MNAAAQPVTPVAPVVLRRPRGRPRKTLDERDDGNRRRELINAAARLFRRQGFAATSTRDIAAAVGMQSGSPFYHFKSKGALLYAVMDEGMRSAIERQQQALALALQRHERPAALLRELIRSHFEILLGPHSDFIPVMLYEWRSLNARQRQAIAKLKDQYEAAWVPLLQARTALCVAPGDPPLELLVDYGANPLQLGYEYA